MKRLFLTSSVGTKGVAESIYHKLKTNKKLKTAFITTPVETDLEKADLSWLEEDRDALNSAGFITFDYTITGKSLEQIIIDLQNIDILYISGGNEFYFREKCTETNFDSFVHDFVNKGGIYIGTSCGSIIAGTDMSPTLQLNDLQALTKPVETHGFGLVDFTILPHWGSQEFKERYASNETNKNMYQEQFALIALNNNQYVEVKDDRYQIIDVTKN